MANFYATARSNYFAVKDETEFKNWAATLNLTVWDGESEDRKGLFAIEPGNSTDSGDWPSSTYDEDTDEYEDYDLATELAPFLADDHVAILMSVGNEKLRYVAGNAVAINNKGITVSVDLDRIYENAKLLGKHLTRAEH